MKQRVEIDIDVFYSNVFVILEAMLGHAEKGDAEYQEAVARIGGELREDGSFRATVKLSGGWDGEKSAWKALEKFIAANRTEKPWWEVLGFADGGEVSEKTKEFFGAEVNV